MRALLDAARKLYAEKGPAAVSVRAVAESAGVNHGLVHRHFGSKEALHRAVLDDLASELFRNTEKQLEANADLPTVLATAFNAVAHQEQYWRVLARALLDGHAPRDIQTSFPVLGHLEQAVIEAQKRDQLDSSVDAKTLVAAAAGLGLGWLLFEPYLLAATEHPASTRRDARARLVDTLRRLLEPSPSPVGE